MAVIPADIPRIYRSVHLGSEDIRQVVSAAPFELPDYNLSATAGAACIDKGLNEVVFSQLDYAGNARMYLGSVPVEDDGSAYFTAPARKPLYFQAVDESGRAVQTMLSEVYLQPGENRGCVGCHEQQQTTFPNSENRVKAALRAPSELAPGPEGSAPFSFPILMQPLLDKRCVECHSGEEGSARPALTGDVEDHFTVSYNRLKPYLQWYAWFDTYHEVVSLPGECGADICPLSGIIDDDNHKDIGLTDEERRLIYFWLDSNIPFYGVYREDEQERQQRGEKVPPPALQ